MAVTDEIVVGGLTLYAAPVGEAMPAVDAAPAGNWVKLGAVGDKNYADDGVTINHPQTVEEWTPLGSTAPRKAFRTEEGFEIEFVLVDITLAQYSYAMNELTVTAAVGPPATDSMPLLRGTTVTLAAILARGEAQSPSGASLPMQYEMPKGYQAAEPSPVYSKGEPAGLAVMFRALEDDTDGLGQVVVQTS